VAKLSDENVVIVTGAAGMLGSALMESAPAAVRTVGVDIADGDLSTDLGITSALGPYEPEVVIHCAGYTDVDGATSEPELAQRHNALATEKVANFCAKRSAKLIYISTDYVFDGTKGSPYTEEDTPNPINAYGRSKLAGERAAQESAADCVIARTSWLFGPGGRNFIEAIVDHARQGGDVWGVVDEIGSPTYTRDIAGALWQLTERPVSGVVHLTNSGYCSRAELARGALDAAGLAEVPITESHPAAGVFGAGKPAVAAVRIHSTAAVAGGSGALRPHLSAGLNRATADRKATTVGARVPLSRINRRVQSLKSDRRQ